MGVYQQVQRYESFVTFLLFLEGGEQNYVEVHTDVLSVWLPIRTDARKMIFQGP